MYAPAGLPWACMSIRAIWIETSSATLAAEVHATATPTALAWAPVDQFTAVRRPLPAVLVENGQRVLGMALWGFAMSGWSTTSDISADSIRENFADGDGRCLIPMDAVLNLGAWGGLHLTHNRWSRWALGLWRQEDGLVHVVPITETVQDDEDHRWTRPLMTGAVCADEWLAGGNINALRLRAQCDETQHAWSGVPIELGDEAQVCGTFAGCWTLAARMPRHQHAHDIFQTAAERRASYRNGPRRPFPSMKLRGWLEAEARCRNTEGMRDHWNARHKWELGHGGDYVPPLGGPARHV